MWQLFLIISLMHVLFVAIAIIYNVFSKKIDMNVSNIDISNFPKISILIPAYNEEKNIENKIKNILSQNYPKDKLEILIGSDGSTDRTAEKARKVENVKVFEFDRSGKASVLNKLYQKSSGDYILVSDADTLFLSKNALKNAVLSNSEMVTAIVGSDELPGLKKYWNIEFNVRNFESQFGKCVVSSGTFIFVKREYFPEIPSHIIADDLFIPLWVIKNGGKSIQNDSIICKTEKENYTTRSYFKKKMRVVRGGIQTLFEYFELKLDFLSFSFFFLHKISRWYMALFFTLFLLFFDVKLFLSYISVSLLLFLVFKKFRMLMIDLYVPVIATILEFIKPTKFGGWDF
ncbi:glycosyltransferase [Marinitoga aeolica]|uniref:Glycosyltransferase n=1 Tax=Marinitoga aeolica TaxID=2809031 RepID=A0ABY8PTT8_9BACT|nr:glycosyltransferase [Marinitoga aeolica]WGS66024.1 glycosyltransferase [Marinitoga aeolica]